MTTGWGETRTTGEPGAERPGSAPGPWLDPGFVLAAEAGLRLTPEACARLEPLDARRGLAMQVARQPLDLRAHVQRIRLLAQLQDAGRLFGALVDLFLVLGPKGRGLREAMLHDVRAALDPDDHAFLSARLADGLDAATPLPLTPGAVIAPGLIGGATLVAEQAVPRAAPTAHDPWDDPFYVPPDHGRPPHDTDPAGRIVR